MDRKEKRLAHMLSQAGRKDLLQLDKEEALFQHLKALLNTRTPLKLNDCRARWVKLLKQRYAQSRVPPTLDIICFTFALRHFNLELIEILSGDVSKRILELIQQAIASVFLEYTTSTSQDSLSILKALPWGDVAHFVSHMDWDLGWKYLDEVRRDWKTCCQSYQALASEKTEPTLVPSEGPSNQQPGPPTGQPSLPSFDELLSQIGQSPA
ncbi:hypothetical protein V8F33_005251 [Rhypophila sp. PSN 637]